MEKQESKVQPVRARLIMFIVTIAILLLSYLALSPRAGILTPLWQTMLFFPDKQTDYYDKAAAMLKIKPEDVYITTANGTKIHGWLYKHPNSKTIVLVSHGNAGNLAGRYWIADRILAAGASALLYDYEGYGKSQGSPNIPNIVSDGTAAYDYVTKDLAYKPENVILMGESLGCAVSCAIAENHACGGLIMQAGFTSLHQIAGEKVPLFRCYPDWLFVEPALNNRVILAKVQVPVLLIHGVEDSLIPIAHARSNYETVKERGTLLEIPGVGHNDIYQYSPKDYIGTLGTFLKTCKQ